LPGATTPLLVPQLLRHLDVTKANLFFARGVAMVEGPAEELLLPAIAAACKRSFTANGVSVVNVGTVGLFRYARIFQRKDGAVIPVPIACVTDRDIVPDAADYVLGRLDKEKNGVPLPAKRKQHSNRKESDFTQEERDQHVQRKRDRASGGRTEVFVSNHWTLEYDLLLSQCQDVMFYAIRLAEAEGTKGALNEKQFDDALVAAADELEALNLNEKNSAIALTAYEPLFEKRISKAIVAQYAAYLFSKGVAGEGPELFKKLPPYLQDTLKHLVPLIEDIA
jgi:putative ATP-dependent endonuclease of the OLD family